MVLLYRARHFCLNSALFMLPNWLQRLVDLLTQYPEWSFAVIFHRRFCRIAGRYRLGDSGHGDFVHARGAGGFGRARFLDCHVGLHHGCNCGRFAELLGRTYKYRGRILKLWPFSKYPQAYEYCEKVFQKHGGKSYFFGRFFGPLRAFMALIAGMMEMPWPRFVLLCVVACSLWAPLYLAPGIAFGTSLELAGDAAGRLVLVLIALGLVALGLRWVFLKLLMRRFPRLQEFCCRGNFWRGAAAGHWHHGWGVFAAAPV